MPRPIEAMLRPSGAAKFMACVSSPFLESAYDDKTSEFAREGTAAHELGERCLNAQCDAFEFEGEVIDLEDDLDPIPVTGEMCSHVNSYVSYIDELLGDDCYVEERVDLIGILPNNGTSDCVKIYWQGKHAYVVDLKYGKGVRVLAEGNKQLRLYAIGVLQTFKHIQDIDEITIVVFQPRLDHIDEFTYYSDELMAFADEVRNAVQDVYTIDEENAYDNAVTGDHCTFCTAKKSCRRYHDTNARAAAERFESLLDFDVQNSTAHITLEELGSLLDKSTQLSGWVTTLEEHALEQLRLGREVPGWKLVIGRSNRKITKPDEVTTAITEDGIDLDVVAPRKMLGITALEKLLGKKRFDQLAGEFVTKPKGKPTLAPSSDKRAALDPLDDFQSFDIEDAENAN